MPVSIYRARQSPQSQKVSSHQHKPGKTDKKMINSLPQVK